ncbi:MAG: VanZ family protein [Planctomycetes bacterium]|nr:VanZ family protein [Planctomycetota bacterium]
MRFSPKVVITVWGVYWLALFAVMHTPIPLRRPLPVHFLDKVVHATAYAILATLCAWWAWRSGTRFRRAWFFKWIVIFAVYAVADELLQPYFNRSAEFLDWLADVLGVLIAFSFVYVRTRTHRPGTA